MKLRISVSTIVQYLLIYFLLLCHDAGIYRMNSLTIRNVILCGTIIILLIYRARVPQRVWLYGVFIIAVMKFLKFVHSDAAFDYELNILLEHLLIAYTAFIINKNKFSTRFVRTIVWFAGASLICFTMANTMPHVLENILISEYELPWAGGYTVYAKGWLIYVYRSFETFRNCGIYTEPGVYQIVLSAALYLLLFCSTAIDISKQKQFVWSIILVATMITTTSTTGYMSLAVLLLTGALQNKKLFPNHRKLRWLFVMGIICIIGEWMINGESSIIESNVFSKFESMEGINSESLSMDAMKSSSGNARLAVLTETIPVILTKPFGVGFTTFYGLLNLLYKGNAAGARLLIYASSMGIVCLCAILYPLFRRAFQNRGTVCAFVAYVFIFLNTGFAQSKALYASFAVIPFVLEYIGQQQKKDSVEQREDTVYPSGE